MPPPAAPADAGMTHDDVAGLMMQFRKLNPLPANASLLSRIRDLEAGMTMKDKEISLLNSQFKDSEGRNAALRQENYALSCSASPKPFHLRPEAAASLQAHAPPPSGSGKVSGNQSWRTCTELYSSAPARFRTIPESIPCFPCSHREARNRTRPFEGNNKAEAE